MIDPECAAAWPEAHSFGYDPRCCRFPKSCSATIPDGELLGSPVGEWEQTAADQLPPASTTGSTE